MKIVNDIHAIRIPFTLNFGSGKTLERFVYVYLLYGKEICLIDSGVASSETAIFEYIRETGRKPEEITRLIQTHAHPDHIGATRAIQEHCGCTVAAHDADSPWIEDTELQYRDRPIPGFNQLVGGPVKVDLTLADGERIQLGESLGLDVIHTPGHSKGSLSFLVHSADNEKILISGDAIPLPNDLPIYENFSDTVRSVKKLRAINDISILLSSWDDPRRGPDVPAIMDKSLNHLLMIHQIVARTVGNNYAMDAMELCRRVVAELGLPPHAATPHLARTFQAHVRTLTEKTT
jgi:hydroxyacylglutathione hydrolase